MKVLFVAGSSTAGDNLALEREITELQRRALQNSGTHAQFYFLPAVSFEDLPLELSRHMPDVLHISAHGENGTLRMYNAANTPISVDSDMLAEFLRYDRPPSLVYMNACNSNVVAKALVDSGVVAMAVGTTAPVTNRTARAAAVLFYDRLLMGSTIKDACSAGAKVMEGLQDKQVSSQLYFRANLDTGTHRLMSVPRLVARPSNNEFAFDKNGRIDIELQLIGAPPETSQVVFFTDDKSFITTDIDDDESDAEFLARELCQVVRSASIRGHIVAPLSWPTDEDFRVYACITTANGKAFSVASTVCNALADYGKYVNPTVRTVEQTAALSAVIGRLKNPDQAVQYDASPALDRARNNAASKPTVKSAGKIAAKPVAAERAGSKTTAGATSKPKAPRKPAVTTRPLSPKTRIIKMAKPVPGAKKAARKG